MSIPLFLVPSLPTDDTYLLDGPEGHHAATVQRLRIGQPVLLGDGRGGTATAEVRAVGRGTLVLTILSRGYQSRPAVPITVVQGIPKGDRGELAVQAMTEVGVDGIVPWAAARSVMRWQGERGDRARERWVATAREATKQSRRPWQPEVAAAASTSAVVERLRTAAGALVLHEEATAALSTVDLPERGDLILVVGPEGGVAPEELALFESAGAHPVRLGDTVLRTSTAGVAALAILAVRLGRW